tara:strand:- start:2179 stop:2787 length:609 start_codon:yes stop_codon:yes gene_type:complete
MSLISSVNKMDSLMQAAGNSGISQLAGLGGLAGGPVTMGLGLLTGGIQAIGSAKQAWEQIGIIDNQISDAQASKQDLVNLHQQNLDIAEDRYDTSVTNLAYGTGSSLYDAFRGVENVKAKTGFATVGPGYTGEDRVESKIRRAHDVSYEGMVDKYGQEIERLEDQHSKGVAEVDMQIRQLQDARREQKKKTGWGGAFRSMFS